jgi:hypothetical protein
MHVAGTRVDGRVTPTVAIGIAAAMMMGKLRRRIGTPTTPIFGRRRCFDRRFLHVFRR